MTPSALVLERGDSERVRNPDCCGVGRTSQKPTAAESCRGISGSGACNAACSAVETCLVIARAGDEARRVTGDEVRLVTEVCLATA